MIARKEFKIWLQDMVMVTLWVVHGLPSIEGSIQVNNSFSLKRLKVIHEEDQFMTHGESQYWSSWGWKFGEHILKKLRLNEEFIISFKTSS
jgi:hypothetical protein